MTALIVSAYAPLMREPNPRSEVVAAGCDR